MSEDERAALIADTIIAQAVKITELEETVLRLTIDNERQKRLIEHHLTMRVQQEGIIKTLRGDDDD